MLIEVRRPTAEETLQMQQWPIWEKEVSVFPWHYEEPETCLILAGQVTVVGGGQTVHFGPGDLVRFPEGLDCTWTITEPVRKHYQFG